MNTSNAWLEVKWGAEVGQSYPLPDRADIMLSQGNTLSISQTGVALPRFRIVRDKDGYRLSDPANAGGILVNGEHLRESHLLKDGDEIAVPPAFILVFHARQPSSGEAPTQHIAELEAATIAGRACPKCGTINLEMAINCAHCRINLEWARTHLGGAGKDLGAPQPLLAKAQEQVSEQGRPGWITAIAILQFIGGLFDVGAGLYILDVAPDIGTLSLGLGVALIVFSVGLWQMREWGRIGTIVTRVFGLIVSIGSRAISGSATGIGGLILSVIILIYLLRGETAKKFR